jgi:dTDP-3-amino-3,4,6-trideoxy-alpha-D-glucose transaminase
VIPVDLFGQLADMSALRTVADRKDLVIVEDACQAHGARREGNAPGTHAELTAYSFYPGKNLGASGDAGAVVTDDDKLASRVRLLREHGQGRKYAHEAVGWTSRLDTIQAVVLARKLPHLDEWNEERRAVAARYLEELAGIDGLRLPPVASASEPVWHLFVVGVEHPEELAAELAERGIATGRHYPQPPHLSGAYESLGFSEGSFPVAERVAREGLSLPIFPGMTDDEVSAVVAAVRAYFHV